MESDVLESSTRQPLLDTYIDEFRAHREAVKAHLTGFRPNEQPLSPALIPPASYWTSAEKDLFFHGLSVYSRFQPELVARNIGTKTTFDVCVYLDALARAAELLKEEEDELEIENGDVQSRRTLTEPAMELSEEWVRHEETIAAALTEVESCACCLRIQDTQNEKTCTCPPVRCQQDESQSAKQDVVENQNRYLNHLDPTCLTALDCIARDGVYEGDADDVLGQRQGSTSSMGTQALGSSDVAKLEAQRADKEQHRRLQKRLYMRRKRAEAAGRAANLTLERLRPGRKRAEKERDNQKSASVVLDDSGESSSDDGHLDGEAMEQTIGPKPIPIPSTEYKESAAQHNKPYRIKKIFTEGGIDARSVVEMDLNFFHLSVLGKMIDLHNLINVRSGSHAISSISVSCIPLLKEIVKAFVTDLVLRLIILKEQEIRLKAKLKVWKYDAEEISADNVAACLTSLGLENLTKENYLETFVIRLSEEEIDQLDAASVTEESEERYPEGVLAQPNQPWTSLPSSYPSSFPCYDFLDEVDTVLLDLDEDTLKRELEEDEIVNFQDERTSKKYEADLWKGDAH